MNVALRAVHDALAGRGEATAGWAALTAELARRVRTGGSVGSDDLRASLRAVGCAGSATDWLRNLRALRVLDGEGQFDLRRAEQVAVALELAADSFAPLGTPASWAPVVTVPDELRALLRPPPLRQTAGVLLELVDRAREEVRLAAPYVDPHAVEFLSEPLLGAGRRAVTVAVLTSPRQGLHFDLLSRRWRDDPNVGGRLRVCEVRTHLSVLGSHAKLMVVDRARGYVGSANLTAAGLGRHVEVGVELAGPQVAELTRVLDALERVGSTVTSTD